MALGITKHKNMRSFLLIFGSVGLVGLVLFYLLSHAQAFSGNNGTIAWGDSTAGRIRIGAYTFGSPGTFGTSFRPTAPVSSAIQFVVNQAAPTRNEKLVG